MNSYTFLLGISIIIYFNYAYSLQCLGSYELCDTGDCVLDKSYCGSCSKSYYKCPLSNVCTTLSDYKTKCPYLKHTHFDWGMDIESRVEYLVKNTNLQEKINQLWHEGQQIRKLDIPFFNYLNDDQHGLLQTHATSFPNGIGLGATFDEEILKEIAIASEARGTHNGKLNDGYRGPDNGISITLYAPNMNLGKDVRWGRIQEVYSEDPFLSSRLTINFVNGIQVIQKHNDREFMLAAGCCKHFAAYDIENIPESRFTFDAIVDTRNFWESYLPVFESCIVAAKGAHVMCSYNSINGIPTCADKQLLTDLLRGKWNFEGFVVSDYDAWEQLHSTRNYCPSKFYNESNYECAASVGINAGLDQEGGGHVVIDQLFNAVTNGTVDPDVITQAFRRLFRIRTKLGLFDPPIDVPWNYLRNDSSNIMSEKHYKLSEQAAKESICLYKNENKTLPLNIQDYSTEHSIAVIGPMSIQTALLQGNYAKVPEDDIISIYEGFLNTFGEELDCYFEVGIDYYQPFLPGISSLSPRQCAMQCALNSSCNFFSHTNGLCWHKSTDYGRKIAPDVVSGGCKSHIHSKTVHYSPGCDDVACEDISGFPDVMNLVQNPNVSTIILVLGITAYYPNVFENEFHDRETIDLPSNQYELVKQIRQVVSSNKPIIGVFVHGGTFAFKNLFTDLDAIVDAWQPSMFGGQAISDVIFGKHNPAGRSPLTHYVRNDDLQPPGDMNFYPHAINNGEKTLGITYRYFLGEVQIPFGFGLSYTTFEYSDIIVNATAFSPCDYIKVSFNIRNSGLFSGDEVAQLYVKQNDATVPVPQIRLAGFVRIKNLLPQEIRRLSFVIDPKYHSAIYEDSNIFNGKYYVEKGGLDIYIGGGQPKYFSGHLKTTVKIISTQELSTCKYSDNDKGSSNLVKIIITSIFGCVFLLFIFATLCIVMFKRKVFDDSQKYTRIQEDEPIDSE